MLITKFFTVALLVLQGGGPTPPPPGFGPTPPGLPVPLDENLNVLFVAALILIVVVSRRYTQKQA